MKTSYHSTNNSQFQSITSKSSNSSIISILREPSPNRPKKKNTVRFDDSPTVSIFSDTHKFEYSVISSPANLSASKSPSPHQYKPLTPSPVKLQLNRKSGNITPTKVSPVRVLPSPEPRIDTLERKATPTTINYAFRTPGFYDKLNRFYSGEPASAKVEPERIFIKLNPTAFLQKDLEEKPVIHLRPCSTNSNPRVKNKSPVKDQKPSKRLRGPGQNILN